MVSAELSPNSGWSQTFDRFVVLDSWRGIAAMAVAIGHIQGSAWFLDNPLHSRSGFAVDFFFVLSGFVIAAGYGERLREGFSVAKFMFLRFFRLWPLHVFVVALFVLLELVFFILGDLGPLQGRVPFGEGRELSTLPATTMMLQAYLHPGDRPWSVPSWSISVEIGLYLLGAVIFVSAGRKAWLIGLLVSVVAVGTLVWLRTPEWLDVQRGLLGFGLGLALYELWGKVRSWEPPHWLASLLEALAIGLVFGLILLFPMRPVVVVAFAALVLVFAYERGAVSRLLALRGFVWLGALSYSIYLMHGMVIGRMFDALALTQGFFSTQLVRSGLGGADWIIASEGVTALLVLAMIGLTLIVSLMTWRVIEEPARKWSKQKVASWKQADD